MHWVCRRKEIGTVCGVVVSPRALAEVCMMGYGLQGAILHRTNSSSSAKGAGATYGVAVLYLAIHEITTQLHGAGLVAPLSQHAALAGHWCFKNGICWPTTCGKGNKERHADILVP